MLARAGWNFDRPSCDYRQPYPGIKDPSSLCIDLKPIQLLQINPVIQKLTVLQLRPRVPLCNFGLRKICSSQRAWSGSSPPSLRYNRRTGSLFENISVLKIDHAARILMEHLDGQFTSFWSLMFCTGTKRRGSF